jgi:hypothetical protein
MDGKYDAFLDEEKASGAASTSDKYGAVLDEEVQQTQARARMVFEKALAVNPDQAAESKKLTNTTGLPPDVVERNLDEVKRKERARMLDLARMVQDSPILARQLMDPSFTKQAHDDLDNLQGIGRTFLGTVGDVGVTALKGAVGLPQAVVGILDLPTGGLVGKGYQELGLDFKRTQNILDGLYSPAQQLANKNVSEADGFLNTLAAMAANPSTILTTVGESLPQMLGGAAIARGVLGIGARTLAAGAVGPQLPGLLVRQFGEKTATVLAGAFGEGSMAAGAAAENMRADNTDGLLEVKQTIASLGLGAGTALFGFAGGKVAQKFGLADIDTVLASKGLAPEAADQAKRGFISSILKSGISEGLFEELPQSVQEQMWQNWATDRPLGEGVGKVAAQGAVAGFAMGGGFQAINRARERMAAVDQAGQSAEMLKQQLDLATQSKLRERNPEEFRALVGKMSADAEVFIDAGVLNQLAPELLAQMPQSVRDQLANQVTQDTAIAVPVADVLTVAPGTPLAQFFTENARMDGPGSMSQAEAKDAGAKAQEYLAQESARVIQQATDQQAMQASSDRVKQTMLDQLNTVGRFRNDVNEAYATWTAAFYTTMGGRLGLTPEEMQAKYPLRITGQGAQAAQGDTLMAQREPGTWYHGTSSDVTKFNRIEGGNMWGPGYYLTDNPDTASGYATGTAGNRIAPTGNAGPNVMPVRVADGALFDMAAPLDAKTLKKVEKALGQKLKDFTWAGMKNRDLRQVLFEQFTDQAGANTVLQKAGFKGVVESNPTAGAGKTLMVFDPKDISSDITGETLAQTPTTRQTDTSEFKAWFGDSKVVDASGNPLVVYHGTPATDLSVFDASRIGTNGRSEGAGFYFTTDKTTAAGYGQVIEVYLSIKKPLAYNTKPFGQPQVRKLLSEVAKAEAADTGTDWRDGFLSNYVDTYDTTLDAAVREAAQSFADEDTALDQVSSIIGSGVDADTVNAGLTKALGYDGYYAKGFSGEGQDGGDIWVSMKSTQIKSATDNSGEFNPNDPNILKQGPRGTFNPKTLELALNENADLSTFLHETGHFFLEVMADLAAQPDAPTDIQADMGKLMSWFGVADTATWNAMTLEQKRPYHERFAESFEQYLMEGKAPSLELQPLFRKFRAWMLNVYKSLKAFIDSRVPVTSGGSSDLAQAAASGYEGSDAGEAAEWLAAKAKGLDMSTEARMVRAKAMGFDTDTTLYHSTLADTDGFQPTGNFMGHTGASGISVTDSPEMASRYLERFGETRYDGVAFQKNVVPVFIKPGKVLARNEPFPMPPGLRLGAPLPAGYVPAHKAMGYDTLVRDDAISRKGPVKHSDAKNAIRGKEYVLTDPSQVRSVFAAFDPDNAASASLLAQDPNAAPGANIQLSDEVRQVFDRMLASEEQIAQANEVAGLLPEENADAEANERLTARSLRDLKWTVNARAKEIKKLQAQAKSLRKDVQAEVTAEVEAMPEFQAKDMLDKTRKENKEQLNDTELAIVADAFSYPDVDTMLKAIDAAGKKADVIQGMTDQRMLERHGDLIDQRAIEEAANEAVHNMARAKSLATELKAQADMLNPRADTGAVNAKGQKITINALTEAAKQFATNVVAKTPLRDLKNKAWQHTAAERRAGKRWQEATAKGQTREAVQAKQDQMLNNAAAKAALDAQGEMRKILDFFKRVIKDNNEKVVDKGRDPDVVNAARAVLSAYGMAPNAGKTALEYMALVEKNDPAMYSALQPSVQGALNMAQPLDSLTMEELRGLHEEIQGMWHLAKRSRQMEVDGNMLDMQDAEDELQARMQAIGVPDKMPGDTGAVTKSEERVRKLQGVRALLRRVEQWAEGMDGKFGGPFLKLVFQPVKDAADRYRADRVKYRKAYQALVDNVAPAMTKGRIAAPELGYTFGEGHNGIGHAELLHAILHTGNESNKRKLLLGRKWATEREDGTLDTTRWDMFIQRMHTNGTLAKVHYDFAQGVWDLLEQTKPLAQKTHRDVFGRYFAEITADKFSTPFGEYAGGYVPAQADPRIVQDADMRALATLENENMSYSFPTTNKGFTNARVEYNRPLMLDLRTIGQHLDKVLLFSHMEPAVRDVNKLLSRKGVSYSLGRIDPAAYSGMLTPWLSRSARQIVETPVVGDGGISRVLSAARNRAGMALMFANVSNTLQQITGFSLAAVKVKPSSMVAATAQFIASPKKTAQAVSEASPFMANRMENEIAAINDTMDKILLDPNLYEKAQAWSKKHAYFLQTAMANTMEPIIWTGAYNDALEQGQSEKAAVRFADNVIRTTQGSTLPEDVSRIETGPAYARIFTQFVGYFNMMANTNATALKQISQEVGVKKGAGKMLGVVTLGLLIPIWVAEAIAIAMRGGPEDEDKDGYLDDWLASVFGMGTIKGTFAMVPFIGQLANAGINRFNGNPADDKVSMSPAVSLLEATVGVPVDVYKAVTDPDKLNKRNAVRDVASAISMLTGLPAVALARPLGYLAGVESGKIDPTGPVDAVRGAITGTPSPESK